MTQSRDRVSFFVAWKVMFITKQRHTQISTNLQDIVFMRVPTIADVEWEIMDKKTDSIGLMGCLVRRPVSVVLFTSLVYSSRMIFYSSQ